MLGGRLGPIARARGIPQGYEAHRFAASYGLPGGYRRVYCFHIRKTGGTSLGLSFFGLGGEDPDVVHRRIAESPVPRTISRGLVFTGHHRRLLCRGDYYFGWSHLASHEIDLPPDTFTVTVLRDPVKRVISHYRMLCDPRADDVPFGPPPAEYDWVGTSFGDFLDRIPREHLLRQLYMFSPGLDVGEAAERISHVDEVLHLEDYAACLERLGARLELPLQLRHDRSTSIEVEISDAELERLRELLEPEYRLLTEVEAPQAPEAARQA